MTVDASALVDSFQTWAEQVVEYANTMIGEDLDAACPISEGTGDNTPGALRDSRVGEAKGLEASQEYPLDYASYVAEGTPAHVIEGNPLLAFHWQKVGRVMILRHVNHPGTLANPWWDNIINAERWAEMLTDAADTIPLP